MFDERGVFVSLCKVPYLYCKLLLTMCYKALLDGSTCHFLKFFRDACEMWDEGGFCVCIQSCPIFTITLSWRLPAKSRELDCLEFSSIFQRCMLDQDGVFHNEKCPIFTFTCFWSSLLNFIDWNTMWDLAFFQRWVLHEEEVCASMQMDVRWKRVLCLIGFYPMMISCIF